MIKKIDHIGIAVNKIEDQLPYYQYVLGLEVEKIEEVPSDGVKVCLFNVGGVHIELLEPLSETSPIKKFLDKHGEGVHHIAYKTDDIHKTMDSMKQNQVQMIDKIPRQGAEGKQICFVHPKSSFGVLTEICQKAEVDNE